MGVRYDVNVKVISQKGHCAYNHKVGDEWVIDGKSPAGMCMVALTGLYPKARVIMFGGVVPWEKDTTVCTHACSDAENPVVFELRRGKAVEINE